MNTINYKYNPGDKVFGINFYQSGAKIFEGKIIEILIKVTNFKIFLGYKISSWPVSYFPEENIFLTKEEAEKAKLDWVKKSN